MWKVQTCPEQSRESRMGVIVDLETEMETIFGEVRGKES